VVPLVLVVGGVVALVAGVVAIQGLGPRVRIGRILASTPVVTVAEARAAALQGRQRYVGVRGRIDAEDEFEDAAHRPLVLRRTRFEAGGPRGWRAFDDQRELVRFELREGLDAIGIDAARLDRGLVVIPRESAGVASDLGDRAPNDLPPTTPVRMVVEQVSSVDHATALGVPIPDGAGGAMLTAGLGRPLVLTTLERPEAIRLLGGGRRTQAVVAGVLLVVGSAGIILGLVAGVIDLVT
jgi:hypothetical protein